jgi:peptidoglycan/LPS O-acetylase OafA/YrhL
MTPGYPNNYIDCALGTLAQSIGCAAIAYGLLVCKWAEINFPTWLVKTGDFSYTLYITHFPILALGLSMSLSISDTSFVFAGLAAFLASAAALVISVWAASLLEDTAAFKRALEAAFDHRSSPIDFVRYLRRQ